MEGVVETIMRLGMLSFFKKVRNMLAAHSHAVI